MMNLPFKGGNTITQSYGQRPEYYKQFGLSGHEGVDIIPSDPDRTIYAVEDGEVVRDIDDPRSGAYGIYCVLLNRATGRAWWYCHESVNDVVMGQQFKKGDRIAVMGGTGNVSGDHLHLGLRLADAQGNALNTNNGFQGFIDPLPVLNELNGAANQPDSVVVAGDVFLKLVGNSTKWDATVQALGITTDPKDTSIETVKSTLGGFKSRITDLTNQLTVATTEVTNREEQVARLKVQCQDSDKLRLELNSKLNDALKRANETAGVYEGQLAGKQAVIDGLGKEKGALNTKVAALQAENQKLKANAAGSLSISDLFTALAKKFAGK
jgi:septal ring factor EnvC (AmiA/AmiB activator)